MTDIDLAPPKMGATLADIQLDLNSMAHLGEMHRSRPATWAVGPCPECSGTTTVDDSRPTNLIGVPLVRRKRTCLGCGFRISTVEVNSLMLIELLRGRDDVNLGKIADHLRGLADRIEAARR